MPYLIKFLCLALLLISGNASAELAVVANPNSGIENSAKTKSSTFIWEEPESYRMV
jgi:hypothetical protein